jgi:hypothetical protein
MTETPTDDIPGFVAEEALHCHACYRLIGPGPTCCLTIGQATLRQPCLGVADTINVSDALAGVVEAGRILAEDAHPFESASLRGDCPLG